MKLIQDQIGNVIRLATPAKRIISLVPSQTELLYDLGLENEVVGITKFCIHPDEWFRKKNRVGGTKNVDFDKIKALHPDLIIANKEENSKEDIEALQKDYEVWISDIYTVEDSLQMMKSIGELAHKTAMVNSLVERIIDKRKNFNQLPPKKFLYFIWKDPYMLAGENTFINQLLTEIGLENAALILEDKRYPVVDVDAIKKINPDVLLCSSEPFPFKDEHLQELEKETGIKTIHIDGEYCSWYGSRLEKAYDYFDKLRMTI